MKSKRIKLAIIDSGLDKSKAKNVLKVYNYTNESAFDLNGHGTSVYNYIQNNCSNVEIIIFKLLNRNGQSNVKAFIRLLRDIINIEVDVICMPFSFSSNENSVYIKQIHDLLYELYKKDVIVICSYMNGSCVSFPACDEYTIGVFGGFLYNNLEYWYRKNTMVTNIYPECIRTLYDKRSFFSGNSKACALATSIVITKCIEIGENHCIRKIDEKLLKETVCDRWDYNMIKRDVQDILKKIVVDTKEEVFYSSEYATIRKIIDQNLRKYVNDKYIEKKEAIFDEESYQLINNMDSFLKGICRELSIEICDQYIYPYDFVNPLYLLCAVKRWIECYEKNKKLYRKSSHLCENNVCGKSG